MDTPTWEKTEEFKELLCQHGHKLEIDLKKRELRCLECGYGRRFLLQEIIEKDSKLTLKDGTPLTITKDL